MVHCSKSEVLVARPRKKQPSPSSDVSSVEPRGGEERGSGEASYSAVAVKTV